MSNKLEIEYTKIHSFVKQYIKRGDLAEVTKTTEKSRSLVDKVYAGETKNLEVLKLLYEQALENYNVQQLMISSMPTEFQKTKSNDS